MICEIICPMCMKPEGEIQLSPATKTMPARSGRFVNGILKLDYNCDKCSMSLLKDTTAQAVTLWYENDATAWNNGWENQFLDVPEAT